MSARQKMPWLRSEPYIVWIRSLPCVITGKFGAAAHHLIGHGRCGTEKTHDFWAIPLISFEHNLGPRSLHVIGWQEWEAQYKPQHHYVSKLLDMAFREGVLKVIDSEDLLLNTRDASEDEDYNKAIVGCIARGSVVVDKKTATGRNNIL